jgi:hypothetical protein
LQCLEIVNAVDNDNNDDWTTWAVLEQRLKTY